MSCDEVSIVLKNKIVRLTGVSAPYSSNSKNVISKNYSRMVIVL